MGAGDGQVVIELVGKDQATQMLVGNLKQLGSQAKQTEREAGGAFGGMTTKIGAFASAHTAAIAGVLVGYASLKGIKEFWSTFQNFAATESALLKTSIRLNTTVESLSSLSYVAQKSGMDVDSFNKSIERMLKYASAAALGVQQAEDAVDEMGEPLGKGSKAFAELGIEAEKFLQLPLDQKLMVFAEAMKQNIDPMDRNRVAMEVFGKTGGQLIVALSKGPEQIQAWIAQYEKLGGVISTSGAKAMSEAKAATGDLSIAWQNFSRELYENSAPIITALINKLTDLTLAAKDARSGLQEWFEKNTPFQQGPESVGRFGEAAESFFGPTPPPKGIIGKGSRAKPGKGGGKGKERTFTEVTPFEQAMWGAEDAEKAAEEAAKALERLLDLQERQVKNQQSYAAEMAGLSPLLAGQIAFKEEALKLENDLALMVLQRELEERKITPAIYDQEVGLRALLTQAKKLSLEREKWSKTGGFGAGLQLYREEQDKKPSMFSGVWWKENMTGAENWIGSTFANTALDVFEKRKTDWRAMGKQMFAGLFGEMMKKNFQNLLSGGGAGGFGAARFKGGSAQWGDVPDIQTWNESLQTWEQVASQNQLAGENLNLAGMQGITSAMSLGVGAIGLISGSQELITAAMVIQSVMMTIQAMETVTSWIPFFHQGGSLQYAHAGWPPPGPGEVDIRALRTERVLSPEETREWEAGKRPGSGGSPVIVNLTYAPAYRASEADRRKDLQAMFKVMGRHYEKYGIKILPGR